MSVRPAEKVKYLLMCSVNECSVSVIDSFIQLIFVLELKIKTAPGVRVLDFAVFPLTEHITIPRIRIFRII